MIHVGERIRKVREAKRLTQTYVAERLNPPVVQTTIGDIEKRPDLKITRAKEIAAILEIDDNLLTDDSSPLDQEDVSPVIRRQSLRRFMVQAKLKPRERKQWESIVDHVLAASTIDGWHSLRDLIQRYLGGSPDRQAASTPEAPSGPGNVDVKKRMARVALPEQLTNRNLRRVG